MNTTEIMGLLLIAVGGYVAYTLAKGAVPANTNKKIHINVDNTKADFIQEEDDIYINILHDIYGSTERIPTYMLVPPGEDPAEKEEPIRVVSPEHEELMGYDPHEMWSIIADIESADMEDRRRANRFLSLMGYDEEFLKTHIYSESAPDEEPDGRVYYDEASDYDMEAGLALVTGSAI